jgi:hypothetical protein
MGIVGVFFTEMNKTGNQLLPVVMANSSLRVINMVYSNIPLTMDKIGVLQAFLLL